MLLLFLTYKIYDNNYGTGTLRLSPPCFFPSENPVSSSEEYYTQKENMTYHECINKYHSELSYLRHRFTNFFIRAAIIFHKTYLTIFISNHILQ